MKAWREEQDGGRVLPERKKEAENAAQRSPVYGLARQGSVPAADTVSVQYRGTLIDAPSSTAPTSAGQPATFA